MVWRVTTGKKPHFSKLNCHGSTEDTEILVSLRKTVLTAEAQRTLSYISCVLSASAVNSFRQANIPCLPRFRGEKAAKPLRVKLINRLNFNFSEADP
jgi:hypothetical protein